MREIVVSNGRYRALIDDEDYARVAEKVRWNLHTSRGKQTIVHTEYKGQKQTPILLHRFVLGLNSRDKRPQVTFKDGNLFNCQKENLEIEILSQVPGVGSIQCVLCKFSQPETEFYVRENGRYRTECKRCILSRKKSSPEVRRKRLLKKKYNITPEEWAFIFTSQGRVCAICQKTEPTSKGWMTDHDHTTNKVRGILCSRCNTMIGQAEENVKTLEKAISYINEFQNPVIEVT